MDDKRIQKILKKADRIRQLNTENNSQEKIDIYHEAGEACRSIGNYDKAIIYFNLELHEAQLANLHDDILYSHRFLGECYLYKNEFYTSEKYHLKFLSLAKSYNDNERIEQAYTCLANTYWLWLSYLQDDMLYDSEYDQFPRDLCKRSFDAANNSLIIIEKLDYQLDIDIKDKRLIKIKDIEEQQQDLALRRVRSYINIANALSEKYLHDGKNNEHLKDFSQYIKKAVELSKKYNLYEELTRIHSSVSVFYLSVPNYLQYKQEILATMKQAIYYAQLTKKANEYLSCLYDIAQTLVSFDDYDDAKMYLVKISQYKITDHAIKEKAMQDLINVQRILTGLEDRYEKEDDLQKKISLAEKCADTYSCLDRNERSKYYYLKQLKHAQELNLNEDQMATIYSSLGSIYQDLKEWQLSIDYFRREMSCRIGLGIQADIEQGYSLCEIIKCEYRLKIDANSRIRTFNRLLTIVRSTNNTSLIRTSIALVFAMKQRDSLIYLNEELEEFIANIQPPITKENYNDILRYSERNSNESIQSDDEQNELDNNTHDSTNRLHLACKEKNGLTQVIQFISEGDNINLTDCHGSTPLHNAVDHENIDIIRYLLNHKANINAKTNNGITPLINACYQGYFDIIELLLTYSARIDIRTNNGYTAVDYLFNYDKNLTSIDQRKLNRFKQLFLVTIRNNEPNYSIQKIIQNDFGRLTNMNNRIDYNIITNKRLRQTNKKNKFSIVKYECDEESQSEQPDSPLYTPAPKRKCTMIDNEHLISDLIEIDHFDFVKSLQLMTPKSTVRSRQASTTSSLNTTIVLSPPPPPTSHIRILRCSANTTDRIIEDKKLRIPISSSDTITNLRYQVLKRLYDNYNIYACFVMLYDKQDWELGMTEADTIQIAIPIDESDIKAVYIEKNPIVSYEQICKEMGLVVYSNIRLILKKFFDKFELSLQRLSLKLEQIINILKIFENFMFIYSINLSENQLTDEILHQLEKITLDQVKSLNLSKNKFTSNGIRKLFEQKIMNNLLILDLSGNTDIDCYTLMFLRTHFPNLIIYH